ncbi:MAG: DUF421 domain-containing protein [Bacillota bacterium]|jgi:uncharacterized membrane protein YcaP (DUF421 family)|nr:DUF421 domain-containing protein [Bacillota bacterium]HOA91012.1 DUF421 domain-containing protein [Bacillota bacterium]HOJ46066.1 DUF421 domain-containing protein [Bacillota bacterium]HOL12856.1 DUF421 domain-containing protein [Bacillota bacterium]HPQ11746.1 DUF421 domain-containing protein [Bacillota bacterium]
MPQGLIVLIRSTFSFFTLFVLTRVMGRRQISQLNFFDYVNGITIGSIAATLAIDISRESLPTFIGLLAYTFWVLFLNLLEEKNRTLRRIINGKSVIVIQNGKILENNLREYGYTIDDLKMILRTQGAFNLADVEYAILEANGRISTLLKSQVRPATPKDFGIDTEYQGIPIDLISDGKIIADNLNLVGLTEDWLRGKLSELRLKPEDVFYAELDTSGKLYVDAYRDPHPPKEVKG